MKLLSFIILLCIASESVWAYTCRDTNSKQSKIEQQIANSNKEILKLSLQINRIQIEEYLRLVEEQGVTIPVFRLKMFTIDKLCDTVPHIAAAHKAFQKTDKRLIGFLKKNAEYNKLYTKLRETSLSDKQVEDVKAQIRTIIESKFTDNPQYIELSKKREAALALQNRSILEYLLKVNQKEGRCIPLHKISMYYNNLINKEHSQFKPLVFELSYQYLIRDNLYKELLSVKYDIPRN